MRPAFFLEMLIYVHHNVQFAGNCIVIPHISPSCYTHSREKDNTWSRIITFAEYLPDGDTVRPNIGLGAILPSLSRVQVQLFGGHPLHWNHLLKLWEMGLLQQNTNVTRQTIKVPPFAIGAQFFSVFVALIGPPIFLEPNASTNKVIFGSCELPIRNFKQRLSSTRVWTVTTLSVSLKGQLSEEKYWQVQWHSNYDIQAHRLVSCRVVETNKNI